MANAATRPVASAEKPRSARSKPNGAPFFGLIDAVLVEPDGTYAFDGAISRDDAYAVWRWMGRDLAPNLIDIEVEGDMAINQKALDSLLPDLLARANEQLKLAETSQEAAKRVRTQLGGEDAWDRLPVVLTALRSRAILEKAQAFGRAANSMSDEAGLAAALQAMPLQDHAAASFVMMSAVGQIANPTRLVQSAIKLSGGPTESALARAGFAPLIDAILAHAQDQLPKMAPSGTFGDMDLLCKAVDRFHRLIRSVNGFVELARNSRWAVTAGGLVKAVSERIDPRLRDVPADVNRALRRREGTDRVDSDQVLSALNGMYLVATVRECRDSLAVNAVFDQVWVQVGQALELHIERNLELLRGNPADKNASKRLEAGIKMAELRFNAEYAEVLTRAKDAAERRLSQQA